MSAEEPAHYRIASSEIVSDVIDGEAVVVNLSTGDYYTLNPTGALVWKLVQDGCSRAELHEGACQWFTGEAAAVRAACDAFLAQLAEEGLIVAGGDGHAPSVARTGAAPIPFAPPALVKYTDLEDLLSLDPVHEVDDLGWPHAAGAKSS